MWLLSSDTVAKIEHAVAAGLTITANQQAEFMASSDTGGIMSVAGGVARINVEGVLTKAPDIMAEIFGDGNTTYASIILALASADSDPEITKAEMIIGSPGGEVNGLFDTLTAMQMFSKPLVAVISNNAESAAYAIAAQADSIIATNPMSRFGSIGVAVQMRVSDFIIDIASTNAPNKRPDVSTEKGVTIVREQLDAVHDVFVEAIATGRGVSASTVNNDFARGATVVAADAKKRGMIDMIRVESLKSVTKTLAANGIQQIEANNMDLNKLKAEHPAVYAEAVKVGTTTEQDRVVAHLTMGDASGDMKTAINAVKDGSLMTATLQAAYMAASMNRRDINDRQADDIDASAADSADGSNVDSADAGDTVASHVERLLGTELGD